MDNWNIISAVSQFFPRSPYILHLWGCDSVYRVAAPVLQKELIKIYQMKIMAKIIFLYKISKTAHEVD